MIDCYYTTPYLASKLVDHIKYLNFNNVVDFCVGDGELIRSALGIWPNIRCFGTDVSEITLKKVRRKHPSWKLGKCDFLNEISRNHCQVIKDKTKGFDLVLLNPPFSCKGGTVYEVTLDNIQFKVSTSMKFICESIKYLTENGCLLAIMPISICYSQKDKKIREYLTENYSLNILETPNGNFFKHCSPSIVFISIKLKQPVNENNLKKVSLGFSNYNIFRGKLSVYDAKYDPNGIPFIHSTNLLNNRLENINKKVSNNTSEINGPAVLIPRVGKPNSQKICLVPNEAKYILSDCILAILLKTNDEAKKVYNLLIANYDLLKELYNGTGAKFITIERLQYFLGESNEKQREESIPFLSGTFSKYTVPVLQPNFAKEPQKITLTKKLKQNYYAIKVKDRI